MRHTLGIIFLLLFQFNSAQALSVEPYIATGTGSLSNMTVYEGAISPSETFGLKLGLYQAESFSAGLEYSRSNGELDPLSPLVTYKYDYDLHDAGLWLGYRAEALRFSLSYLLYHSADFSLIGYEGGGLNLMVSYELFENFALGILYQNRTLQKLKSTGAEFTTSTPNAAITSLSLSFPFDGN